MNGWNPEVVPAQNKIDEPPRHAETYINVGNAAMSGVMFVALTASIYGGVKAGAIDAVIGAFRTGSEVTRTTTEVSQAPKVVKPVAKDVGGIAGEQGSKLQEVGAKVGRGAVGIETVSESDRLMLSKDTQEMFDGSYPSDKFLIDFIRVRGDEEKTQFKNMNIVGDPTRYNSRMLMVMELMDEEIQKRKINPDQLAKSLVKVGQPKRASEFWEKIYNSFKTENPLPSSEVGEIRSLFEEETGLTWTE